MTTQAMYLAVLDPSRGWFWLLWSLVALAALIAAAELADRLAEPRRDPTGVMSVYSLRTARRVLARVDRLDLESSAAGGAAYRHLATAAGWLQSERHRGGRRRQAALSALLADVAARLTALGYDPETGDPATGARQLEVHDGLPVPTSWAGASCPTRPAPHLTNRYRQALEAAGVPPAIAAGADVFLVEQRAD